MKCIVLGGAGFIGSHIVDALLSKGADVRVFTRAPDKFRNPLPDVEYVYGDFCNRSDLERALKGGDNVYHALSTTFPGNADRDPARDVSENLLGTLQLLDLMARHDIRRLVYLSSGGTVYGIPEMVPIPEEHTLLPIGSYGIVKAAVESYINNYAKRGLISPVVLRPSNPFGARQSNFGRQGVISTFMKKALMSEPLEIWGDGTVTRDYIPVEDLAKVAARAGLGPETGTYNVGSGKQVSINELIGLIEAVSGKSLAVKRKEQRLCDVPRIALNCDKARKTFGLKSDIDLMLELEKTWQWYVENAHYL